MFYTLFQSCKISDSSQNNLVKSYLHGLEKSCCSFFPLFCVSILIYLISVILMLCVIKCDWFMYYTYFKSILRKTFSSAELKWHHNASKLFCISLFCIGFSPCKTFFCVYCLKISLFNELLDVYFIVYTLL